MEIELRDYQIRPGHMDDWIAGWRAGVVPIRLQHGFTLLGAWVERASDRFVWLVGYDGPGTWDEADDRYYYSPERSALDPDPATFVEGARKTRVESVDP